MSWQRPPFERPPRPGPEPSEVTKGRRFNPLLVFGIPLFTVAALYVLLVVVTMADDIFFPGNELPIPKVSPFEKDDPEVADINQRINVLFLGLDRRVGVPEHTAARTDSVFVLTIDPFSKTAGVFSIPRDLVVEIPDGAGGYIEDRVNVAWELGEFTYEGYPGGGPGLAMDTIAWCSFPSSFRRPTRSARSWPFVISVSMKTSFSWVSCFPARGPPATIRPWV